MRQHRVLATVLVCLLPTCAHAQPSDRVGDTGVAESAARWVRLPAPEDVAAVYPREAQRQFVGARVRLHCHVKDDGALDRCTALQADPPGQGFEAAALALTPKFAMRPRTVDGLDSGEATVIFPVRFSVDPRAAARPHPLRRLLPLAILNLASTLALLLWLDARSPPRQTPGPPTLMEVVKGLQRFPKRR